MWILSKFSKRLVNLSNADEVYLDKGFYEGPAVIASGRGTNEDTGMFCVLFCSRELPDTIKYFDELKLLLTITPYPSPWNDDPTAAELLQ